MPALKGTAFSDSLPVFQPNADVIDAVFQRMCVQMGTRPILWALCSRRSRAHHGAVSLLRRSFAPYVKLVSLHVRLVVVLRCQITMAATHGHRFGSMDPDLDASCLPEGSKLCAISTWLTDLKVIIP